MATQVQFRRGTTSQNNAFTGAQGELTIDTDVWTIRIHDGATSGGKLVPTLTATQTFTNKTMGTSSVWNGNAIGLGYGGTGAALTGVAGAIVYSSGSAFGLSLAGTSGQVLTSGGTSGPTWVNASALSTGTATTATTAANIEGGSAGYLVYQEDTDTTSFIAPGTSGYVLRSTGASTAPEWVTSALTIGTTALQVGDTAASFDGLNILTASGTSHWKIPAGTTLQRPGSPAAGMIRYNSTQSTFEGYSSGAWSSLGGVKSVDAFTYIIAETSAGAGNGDLDFYAENSGGDGATQVGQWNRTNLKDYTGTLVGTQTTQNVFNATATTVNAFGAATTLTIGASSSGTATIRNTTVAITNNATVGGTLGVTGTTTLGNLTIGSTKTVSMGSNRITNVADPSSAQDAATKAYVDSASEGLRSKPSVRAATTTNLSANYSNGTAGVGATLTADSNRAFTTLDGVSAWSITSPPMGVLVKNQTNPAHNGRYNLTTLGDAGTPWVLTKCALCDQANEIPGSYVFVQDGTLYGGTGWVQTVDDPATFVVGTDDVDILQFSGSGTYTAGTGLTLTGTQYSVNASQTQITAVGTLTSGTWNATVVTGQYGGTGVANTGKTITLGGNLTTSGAYATTLTATATTSVTLPTTGTLATLAGSESLSNKTITSSSFSGTTGAFSGQITSTVTTGTAPLVIASTTKVANLNVEQVDGYHAAEANTASNIVVRDSASKIYHSGSVFSGSSSGTTTIVASAAAGTTTLTLPAATDTLVGKATTDTLTNKTLTSPTLTTPVLGTPSSGTLTSCTGLPLSTGVTGTLAVANGGTGVTSSTGSGSVVLSASPTLTGTLTAATISATTITETSDQRLKTNIVPLTNALDTVLALEGKAFIKDGKASIGLIAQQVQTILPQVVVTADDEMQTLSVQYGNIVAVLIEAVKEQQKQIEELKAKLG